MPSRVNPGEFDHWESPASVDILRLTQDRSLCVIDTKEMKTLVVYLTLTIVTNPYLNYKIQLRLYARLKVFRPSYSDGVI